MTPDLDASLMRLHDALCEIELATMELVGTAAEAVDSKIRSALESIRHGREQLASALPGAPP